MSTPKSNLGPEVIFVGVLCIVAAAFLFHIPFTVVLTNDVFAWITLGLSLYAIVGGIVAKTPHAAKAESIGGGLAIAFYVVGLILRIKGAVVPIQLVGFTLFFLAIIGFAIIYALVTRFERRRAPWAK
jgi:hypothetical protein